MHVKFATLALLSMVAARETDSSAVSFSLCWCCFCFLWLAVAYARQKPDLLLKEARGSLSWPSRIGLAPYHLLNLVSLWMCRFSSEAAYHEIVPGLYLGRRLSASQARNLKVGAVLDVTAEFAECSLLLSPSICYKTLPCLDTCALSSAQLEEAARFIAEHLSKSVYVHCALGHGRSASAVAAYLLSSGQAGSPQEAVAYIQARRSQIGLTRAQMVSLETVSCAARRS